MTSAVNTFPRAADVVAMSKTNMSLSLFLPLAATDIGLVPRVAYNQTQNKRFKREIPRNLKTLSRSQLQNFYNCLISIRPNLDHEMINMRP